MIGNPHLILLGL